MDRLEWRQTEQSECRQVVFGQFAGRDEGSGAHVRYAGADAGAQQHLWARDANHPDRRHAGYGCAGAQAGGVDRIDPAHLTEDDRICGASMCWSMAATVKTNDLTIDERARPRCCELLRARTVRSSIPVRVRRDCSGKAAIAKQPGDIRT